MVGLCWYAALIYLGVGGLLCSGGGSSRSSSGVSEAASVEHAVRVRYGKAGVKGVERKCTSWYKKPATIDPKKEGKNAPQR